MRVLAPDHNPTVVRTAGIVWNVGSSDWETPDGWALDRAAPAEVHVGVSIWPPPELHDPYVFEPRGFWSLRRGTGRFWITIHAPLHPPADSVVELSEDFSLGRIWKRDIRGFPVGQPLDQIWTLHRLGATGGLLLHAGAVTWGNCCDVFVGVSGAGKSTLTSLLVRAGGEALSDERIVARRVNGNWVAFGTPWNGTEKFRSPHFAPVRRILFLSHGPRISMSPLARSQAVAALFRCLLFARWLVPCAERTLAAVESLVSEVPCFRFQFPPDQRAVEALAA